MTPVGVFFSAQIPTADFLRPLCQQLHHGAQFVWLQAGQALLDTLLRCDPVQ